jgi:hypothetical protein
MLNMTDSADGYSFTKNSLSLFSPVLSISWAININKTCSGTLVALHLWYLQLNYEQD